MIKNNVCNNCGKQGHLFHQCKLPITSYGIILFRSSEEGLKYLMIRRKDSFGYIDLLRGKYIQHNVEQLQNIFNEMSIGEREKIRVNCFETLWKQMWGDIPQGSQYRSEEFASQKKFETLRNGMQISFNEPKEMISLVSQNIKVPLIVGGGIRSKHEMDTTFHSGADMIVIGTAFENDINFFNS